MIRVKSHSIDNISIINDKFQASVRQRFIEIYSENTGSKVSTDFILTITSTGGKIYLSLEIGSKRRSSSLTRRTSESDFRNKISESEFRNKSKLNRDSNAFQEALDQLMDELPSLYDDAKEK